MRRLTALLALALPPAALRAGPQDDARARAAWAYAVALQSRKTCTCGDHCPAGPKQVRVLRLKGRTVTWTQCLCGCGMKTRTEKATRFGPCTCERCPADRGGRCPCGCQGGRGAGKAGMTNEEAARKALDRWQGEGYGVARFDSSQYVRYDVYEGGTGERGAGHSWEEAFANLPPRKARRVPAGPGAAAPARPRPTHGRAATAPPPPAFRPAPVFRAAPAFRGGVGGGRRGGGC
jgi:hypothetical protein